MMIDGDTKVVGLLGDPVGHSLSPAMHNAAFRKLGLNFCYLPFQVAAGNLSAAVRAITALGLRGVNVTAPHKETIVPCLGALSGAAQFLQAVNTVINDNGILFGENTDVDGFTFLLQNNLKSGGKGERALLLGAGGAAKAAALALLRAGIESVTVANRTLAKAEKLKYLLKAGMEPEKVLKEQKIETAPLDKKKLQKLLEDATLIVNALSSDPYEMGLLPRIILPGTVCAIDLRYSPPETAFLRWARESGCRSINGLDMLLGQGARAFEIFTGLQEAPIGVMKKALLKVLQQKQ
jgi:shikimate dehydrogenase